MIGISRVGQTISISGNEKRDQKINTVSTGVKAAGIAGTAAVAGAVVNRVKTAISDDRLMKETHPNLKYKAKSIVDRVIVSMADLVNKITTPIKTKLTSALNDVTKKVLDSSVGKKFVVSSTALASDVAYKSSKVLSNVQNYVTNLPKPVKIAALAATGILAVSHVYRSGQISGIFAAPKQES